jgi:hypothetical protein
MPVSAVGGPILVGFAESLAAPEAVFSLIDGGFSVAAFHRAGRRPALVRSSAVTLHPIVAPEDDASAAVAALVAVARQLGAVAVMPFDDAALWLSAEAAGELPCPVIGPTGPQAALALDKHQQLAAATTAGLDVPETMVCTTPAELLALDRFPAVVKPSLAAVVRDGRLTRGGAQTVADADGLARAAAGWDDTGPRLVQPLLTGVGEGLFGLARRRGDVVAWSAHRRLRMLNPAGSGSSACAAARVDPPLTAPAERFLQTAGWQGMFMIELLRDHAGRAWFMELNGRSWGSMALARRRGLEYPAWAATEVLDPDGVPALPLPALPDLTCRHLGRDLVHLLAVLRGPAEPVADWPPRWRTAREVLRPARATSWYNWRRDARGVFVQDTVDTVVSALRRAAAR